jgi:4-hydroxybenzoate polyprenyltransferase
MRGSMNLLSRLATAIQLTRLTIAFGAVSDIWFVIFLLRSGMGGGGTAADAAGTFPGPVAPSGLAGEVLPTVATMPLPAALVAGAIIAVGLFAYGASLNDVLDVRHDSTFSPSRPIPAGRIGHAQAMVVTVGSLIIAVLGAAWIGTWSVCITLLAAAGILFYNATGKYIPAVGVVTMGLVHAAHMFIPAENLAFTWPVWLVMTHAVGIAAAVHVLEGKRPRFDRRGITLTVVGWLFWSLVLLWIARVGGGQWPADVAPWRVSLPLATMLAFVVVARHKTAGLEGRRAAEKVRRYGAMWQALYAAAWLGALGLTHEAVWMGLFALGGFVVMTMIKEISGAGGRPLAYR